MGMSTDQQLHELYFELAEIQAKHGHATDAADHFALALYYARRMGAGDKTRLCQQRITECRPAHAAGHDESAPLYFAQLLIRYPADEAAQSLDAYRRSGLTPSVSSQKSSAATFAAAEDKVEFPWDRLPDPFAVGSTSSPFASSSGAGSAASFAGGSAAPAFAKDAPASPFGTFPSSESRAGTSTKADVPAGREPATVPPEFENHHVYDLGTTAAETAMASSRAVKDYLDREKIFPRQPAEYAERGFWGSAVHAAAFAAVACAFAAIGFFGYDLYPKLASVDPATISRMLKGEPAEVVAVMTGAPTQAIEDEPSTRLDPLPLGGPAVDDPRIGVKRSGDGPFSR